MSGCESETVDMGTRFIITIHKTLVNGEELTLVLKKMLKLNYKRIHPSISLATLLFYFPALVKTQSESSVAVPCSKTFFLYPSN